MTYYGGREMAASFRTVRNNTLRIAEEIPEESYGFRAADGCRTIGQTLLHIAAIPTVQTHVHQQGIDDMTKVDFALLMGANAKTETQSLTKKQIIETLKSEGDRFASYLESVPESLLAQQVKMFPGAEPATKSRLEMLMSVKEHEMHHRAQLMTLQRMLGLTNHLTRAMQEHMARVSSQAQK